MAKAVLFENARVHTVDRRWPEASWFTVSDTKFQRVGNGTPPNVKERVDLHGAFVVPGFVDAHAHFFQTGIDLLQIDLSHVKTLAQLHDTLTEQAPKRGWIISNRFEEDKLSDVDVLTRHHLDLVSETRPVWVNRVDYHSAVCNSNALKRLRIPPKSLGLMRDEDGEPNGVLRADAYSHAKRRLAQQYSIDAKEKAVRAAASDLLRCGVTTVHALEGGTIFGDEGVPVLLRRMDKLPIYVVLFLQEKNVYFTSKFGFDHLGGCILIDGSIGSYTAALNEDYEGNQGRGLLYEKQRSFFAFVDEAHQAGVQLAFHAIGPRAIQLVLDAYEKALVKTPRHDHRHRIEHFELATDAQIRKAAELGVIVSMQPSFEYFWGGPNGMYATRLGPRWKRTNRIRDILDAGVCIAGGSDTLVTPANPMLGIHAAVNHPNPAQRATVTEAIEMMTLSAAFAGFTEGMHGSISPGKHANFVVLTHNLLELEPSKLETVKVSSTYYRGKQVYEAAHDHLDLTRP